MAAGCYGGRRLSELLEEQQEPFLLDHATTEAAPPCCFGDATGRRSMLGRAVRRRVVRLAGCFSCAARERFRRLPRAGDTSGSYCADDEDDDVGRRLSPVSVLDVLRYSEEESHSSLTLSHWEEEEEPSSTSESSPSGRLIGSATSPPATLLIAKNNTHARTTEVATTRREEEQMIISSWERIAGDIARVPALAELDLSASVSAPEWMPLGRRRLGLREASRRVGASIEAMIFEEVRAEAVLDMLSLRA